MPQSKFTQWVQSWWQRFDKMEKSQAYEISKCAKDQELFIEVCKNYIDNSEHGNKYEFSNDYKYFKKFIE